MLRLKVSDEDAFRSLRHSFWCSSQVQTTAADAKSAAVAQLHHNVDACRLKAVERCRAALSAGWADGLPRWADPQQWADSLLQRYQDCKAEDSLASSAQEQVCTIHELATY